VAGLYAFWLPKCSKKICENSEVKSAGLGTWALTGGRRNQASAAHRVFGKKFENKKEEIF
jgi:hypothetical protein